MATFLVTGASRGLGLEFVRQLVGHGENVIATCRGDRSMSELDGLYDTHENLQVMELEVSDDGTISGVIQGERGEQQITDGWVSGNEFSITASATMGPGMEVEIVYTGTVEGDAIEGNASFGGMRNMDFTGTRPGGGVR